MKFKNWTITMVLLLSFSGNSWAGGWTEFSTVDNIFFSVRGRVLVNLDNQPTSLAANPDGCAKHTYYWSDSTTADRLVIAKEAGITVKLYLNGCDDMGAVNGSEYPVIKGLLFD